MMNPRDSPLVPPKSTASQTDFLSNVVPQTISFQTGPTTTSTEVVPASYLVGNQPKNYGTALAMSDSGNTVVVGMRSPRMAVLYKGCKTWDCRQAHIFTSPIAGSCE